MALALTKFSAYGTHVTDAHRKRSTQKAILEITGLNSDTTWDIGTDAGTFWTAAKANATYGSGASKALEVLQAIQANVLTIKAISGSFQQTYNKVISTQQQYDILTYTSAASSGGAATEAMTVTGLLSTDTILSVTQSVKGANSTALNAYASLIDNGLTASWTANPGASAVIVVTVQRAATSKGSQFTQAIVNTRPNFVFSTTSAPTSATVVIEWELINGQVALVADIGA